MIELARVADNTIHMLEIQMSKKASLGVQLIGFRNKISFS